MKKSFKDNPAMRFISTGQTATGTIPDAEEKPTAPMKPNPLYIETKSKRLQLLIQPTLHRKLKDRATAQGVSLNELIHTALQEYTEGEG
jgi:hypothetical protein